MQCAAQSNVWAARSTGGVFVSLFPISAKSQAYVDGYKSGRADRTLGIKLDVSFYGGNSTNEYYREYSGGYRVGVLGLKF